MAAVVLLLLLLVLTGGVSAQTPAYGSRPVPGHDWGGRRNPFQWLDRYPVPGSAPDKPATLEGNKQPFPGKGKKSVYHFPIPAEVEGEVADPPEAEPCSSGSGSDSASKEPVSSASSSESSAESLPPIDMKDAVPSHAAAFGDLPALDIPGATTDKKDLGKLLNTAAKTLATGKGALKQLQH